MLPCKEVDCCSNVTLPTIMNVQCDSYIAGSYIQEARMIHPIYAPLKYCNLRYSLFENPWDPPLATPLCIRV